MTARGKQSKLKKTSDHLRAETHRAGVVRRFDSRRDASDRVAHRCQCSGCGMVVVPGDGHVC